NTSANPLAYQMGDTAPSYTTTQAQLTRVFSPMIEAYVGAENLFNYYQKHAIIATDAPFGTYFDASMAYAPVQGRMIYAGLRFKLK
ncbi:MAG: TonB-dependent receptor, partial [Capnocytophaga granulosa]